MFCRIKKMNSDRIQSAENLKDNGNTAFKNGQIKEAVDYYTEALALNPEKKLKATIYRNRAMVRLQMDNFEGCEMDATQGIINYSTFQTFYFRKRYICCIKHLHVTIIKEKKIEIFYVLSSVICITFFFSPHLL